MGTLDELKKIVADAFEAATDRESIDRFAKINNSISDVEIEQNELLKKNAELVESYKKLVMHTSFSEPMPVDDIGATAPDFNEMLTHFLDK